MKWLVEEGPEGFPGPVSNAETVEAPTWYAARVRYVYPFRQPGDLDDADVHVVLSPHLRCTPVPERVSRETRSGVR